MKGRQTDRLTISRINFHTVQFSIIVLFFDSVLLAGALPVCVAVAALQHLDDLRQQVGGVSRTQQVQKNLLAVFVVDDFFQGREDFLNGGGQQR